MGGVRNVLGYGFLVISLGIGLPATADETCQSPFMPKIVGQEDFVYIWTLGIDGVGDGSDKLVTVGVNPERPDYGTVVASVSVGHDLRGFQVLLDLLMPTNPGLGAGRLPLSRRVAG